MSISMDDMLRANEEWGANCGPGAIAAIMGMTLDDVRPHLGDFENKRYTNPTLMWSALRSLKAKWSINRRKLWPMYGLARIQWEGPWTEEGVHPKARYRYTHWVGAMIGPNGFKYAGKPGELDVGVFDINALANGSGWCSLNDWERTVVPFILEEYPRANGRWHITHSVEVERNAARAAA